MQISNLKNKNYKSFGGIRLMGNLKVLITMALFIALSMVFKQISVNCGPFRIGFENLPLLLSGIMFGPVIGFIVGAAADVFGCIFSGFPINPLITLGAASIGLVSGIVYFYFFENRPSLKVFASVAFAHVIGSMIIKSFGLFLWYNYELPVLLLRIPLYIIIGTVEGYVTYLLMKNKAFLRQLEKIRVI